MASPKLAHYLPFQKKFYWSMAMLICLQVVYGCFFTTTDYPGVTTLPCDGGVIAMEVKWLQTLTSWPFIEAVC